MPVTIEERYKRMFEQLRFASEIRFKIFAAWGSAYVALAAMFAWIQSSNVKTLSCLVPLLGTVATIVFWLAERRNRPAIGAAKSVGDAIEADPAAEIPEQQRYFSKLEEGVRFGVIVDVFAGLAVVVLLAASVYLYCSCNQGTRPSENGRANPALQGTLRDEAAQRP